MTTVWGQMSIIASYVIECHGIDNHPAGTYLCQGTRYEIMDVRIRRAVGKKATIIVLVLSYFDDQELASCNHDR